ncbi:heat stress transcription factor A-5 [Tanacetum coccineum]
MEPSTTTTGGGTAPFLVKTYEMVDDKTTDEIVSWSTRENSFVVWDPPDFSRVLLPITQSCNEDGGSSQLRLSEGCTRTTEATPGRLLELSDTCTSFGFNMGSSLTHKTGPTLDTNEETEGHPSCQLNLTLASSVSQINPCQENDTIPQSFEDIRKATTVPTRVNDVFWEHDGKTWFFRC